MSYIESAVPAPTQNPATRAVSERAYDLLQEGAVLTDPLFSVATDDQIDLVYRNRRLLLGVRDEAYDVYEQVLGQAGLPHLALDLSLSNTDVFVDEIPRDARSIPQIARSKQSERGTRAEDVLLELGRSIGVLAAQLQMLPHAADISLGRVLARRIAGGVLLVPPLRFVLATEQSQADLSTRIHTELWPAYERFGATTLLRSFKEGLEL